MMNDDARTVERLERLERLADHYERAGHPSSAETIREGIELIKTKSAEIERLTARLADVNLEMLKYECEADRLKLRWSNEGDSLATGGLYLIEWANGSVTAETMDDVVRAFAKGRHARRWCGPITVSEPEDRNQS